MTEYYRLLNLQKEPFSSSPDPDFFFHSHQHATCLQQLELSIRTKRGLSVITGEVGTGKTTLCRRLIQRLSFDKTIQVYLILDPDFQNSRESLTTIADFLGATGAQSDASERMIKEIIKKQLVKLGVDGNTTAVLIIDEGQKMPSFFMEVLRELLNFETNQYKLLQIIIFAQNEFEWLISTHQNFVDRVAFFYQLRPMTFRDTIQMVRFRIERSAGDDGLASLFTFPALWRIYRFSGGYPRKIVQICHLSILRMIVQSRPRVGWFQVYAQGIGNLRQPGIHKSRSSKMTWGVITLTILVMGGMLHPDSPRWKIWNPIKFTSGVLPETGTPSRTKVTEDREGSVQSPLNSFDEKPAMLGRIRVMENETLSELIRYVYGSLDSKGYTAVIDANPQIKNPNRITVGEYIRFPALPNYLKKEVFVLGVKEETDLETAFRFYQTIQKTSALPLRMVSCWRAGKGLHFSIIAYEIFENETDARNRMAELKLMFVSDVSLDKWTPDMIFYTDFRLDAFEQKRSAREKQ